MANALPPLVLTGTLGELLVQVRLLQFHVQAAPPIKDSGNDLVAFHGTTVRTIQVKTATGRIPTDNRLPEHYDILALVVLDRDTEALHLDRSRIYLVPCDFVDAPRTEAALAQYELRHHDAAQSMALLERVFANGP
jgi:hypothetical protein